MLHDELDLIEREERIFNCFQAALDLLNSNGEVRDPARVKDLLDFLTEEYNQAREALMARVAAIRQGARRGLAAR
jgi:hypothetical protein